MAVTFTQDFTVYSLHNELKKKKNGLVVNYGNKNSMIVCGLKKNPLDAIFLYFIFVFIHFCNSQVKQKLH